MLFGRLFGAKKVDEGDDEAPEPVKVRHAPAVRPVPAPGSAPAPAVERTGPHKARLIQTAPGSPKAGQGFDPYNSGAFTRTNAWERVNKR